ncbi:MAG: hypothetical protein ACPGWS_03370 [Solirubrobacterales bacterium]
MAHDGSRAPSAVGTPNGRARMPLAATFLLLLCSLLIAGCGGDEAQDADAPTGTWTVEVVDWNFPKVQPLGRPVDFEIVVRNDDERDIPQLILTIAGMRQFVEQRGAATITRPVWIPNDVNYANVTPYDSALAQSFNLGPLVAGETKEFKLPLTPLRRGKHRIGYSLAGDLYGSTKLLTAENTPAASTRIVAIDPTPDFDSSIFDD